MASHKGQKCFLLRIELIHSHRPIWREVILPADLSLHLMHYVIQDTMGWECVHHHEFEHKGVRLENNRHDAEKLFSLHDFLKRAGSHMTYTYDFGDEWVHSITLKKTLYPSEAEVFTCTDGEGGCPLEDCGGVYGHQRICRYLEDPQKNDDRYMPYEEWIPEGYDPDFVDFEAIQKCLEELKLAKDKEDESNREIADQVIYETRDPDELFPDELFSEFEDLNFEEEETTPYENLSPSDESEFNTLLDLGVQIRQAEPWKDLWDQDIFGVRDPASGLLDFVSILGRGGEVFAVHVHRPPESYALWEMTQNGTLPMDNVAEYLRRLRMVEIQFVKKSELEEDDLFLYELLDFPSPKRGKNRWMQARRYQPRGIPWFPSAEELPPLIRGTALTLRLIHEMRSNPAGAIAQFYQNRIANGERLASFPVFSLPEGQKASDWDSWKLEVSPIDWDESGGVDPSYQPSEFELERIASLPLVNQTWEVGAVYLEEPISNGTEPVIPILAIASPTEQIGDPPQPHLSLRLDENPGECVWRAFFKTATERNQRPAALQVTTETGIQTFKGPAAKIGMQLHLVDQFSLIDQFFLMMQSAEF